MSPNRSYMLQYPLISTDLYIYYLYQHNYYNLNILYQKIYKRNAF